jgi:hypothetical protein
MEQSRSEDRKELDGLKNQIIGLQTLKNAENFEN